jgi:hypothetical protein
MTEETQTKRKPRKHNPAWKDENKPERNRTMLRSRRATLDEIARSQGWKSWHVYETAVINKVVDISPGS